MKKLYIYWSAQFFGAFLAAGMLYFIFSGPIAQYELLNEIVRGSPASMQTAKMFGEFYLGTLPGDQMAISTLTAFCAEALGTFLLVFMVFSLTEGCNIGRPDDSLVPLITGFTLAIIICIIAPLTQAGFNPARDLSPRIFAWLAGWKAAAFPDQHYGFLTVYVFGPLTGGSLAALFFTKLVEPSLVDRQNK